MKRVQELKEQEECEGCRFPGLFLSDYARSPFVQRKDPKRLCNLCASSFMGNAVDYPEQYPDHEAMQMTAFCTQTILKRLSAIETKLDTLIRKA